ncbi:MAG: ISL3 family transposase [Dehalococcoidia bacterium]
MSVTAICGTGAGTVRIALESSRTSVPCPECGGRATRVHRRSRRTLTDRPWQGLAVQLMVPVRRFFCEVVACSRRSFAERLPGLVKPHGQRRERLTTLFAAIGVALGGEPGARLVADLGLTTSPETLLRAVRAMPLPAAATPRVLGVADWARKRGQTSGTVLVDQEQHGIVDLLADRTAETLAIWLKAPPGVESVTRDRASASADGIRQGAPDAVPIADRWHLLGNVGDALERVRLGRRAELRQATAAPTEPEAEAAAPSASTTADATPPELPTLAGRTDPQAPQAPVSTPALPLAPETPTGSAPESLKSPGTLRLQARSSEVLARHRQGLTMRASSRQTRLSRMTIRQYLQATSCPERPPQSGLLASLSVHETSLRQRWDAGCHNAATLWQELRARGFAGSAGTVRRFVGAWRPAPGRRGRPPRTDSQVTPAGQRAAMVPPSPRRVKWWLLQSANELTAEQRQGTGAVASP